MAYGAQPRPERDPFEQLRESLHPAEPSSPESPPTKPLELETLLPSICEAAYDAVDVDTATLLAFLSGDLGDAARSEVESLAAESAVLRRKLASLAAITMESDSAPQS